MANVSRSSPNDETPRAIRDLIEKGRRDRHLNESEILALFDDPDSEEAQALFDQLEEMGVEILIDEHSVLDLGEPLVPDLDANGLDAHDLESLDNGLDVARLEPSVLADDPVRMYLKEIGQVQLLDPDRETWLSSDRKSVV